jgi:hypothetical protein
MQQPNALVYNNNLIISSDFNEYSLYIRTYTGRYVTHALTALSNDSTFLCLVLPDDVPEAPKHVGASTTVELGYNVMKRTAYFVSL